MTRAELLAACRRGVLFSTPMVQELLPRGIKDRTMRAMKGMDEWVCWKCCDLHDIGYNAEAGCVVCGCGGAVREKNSGRVIEPRHKVGDILYVRETWAEDQCHACEGAPATLSGPCVVGPCLHGYVYRADGEKPEGWAHAPRWMPSIHMPKAAARIFIRITGIKVQRPQELTAEEILAEGIDQRKGSLLKKGTGRLEIEDTYESRMGLVPFAKWKNSNVIPGMHSEERFIQMTWSGLWDSLRTKKDLPLYGYDANPLCWTYEFEVMSYDE